MIEMLSSDGLAIIWGYSETVKVKRIVSGFRFQVSRLMKEGVEEGSKS